MISIKEAKKIIYKLGMQLECDPMLIATRLLSDLDKVGIIQGLISIESLRAHIELFKQYGLQDYVTGKIEDFELPFIE